MPKPNFNPKSKKSVDELYHYIQQQFENFETELSALQDESMILADIPGTSECPAAPRNTCQSTPGKLSKSGSSIHSKINLLHKELQNKVKNFENDINLLEQSLNEEDEDENAAVEVSQVCEQKAKCNAFLKKKFIPSTCHIDRSSFDVAQLLDTFQKKIFTLEEQISQNSNALIQVQNENRNLKTEIESLRTTVSNLEKNKADTVQVEKDLSNKANLSEVDNKMSRNDFDSSVSDVTRQMDGLLSKVSSMEIVYDKKIIELSDLVSLKMDVSELDNFKSLLETRLKNLKALLESTQNHEDPAAKDFDMMASLFRKPTIGFQDVSYDKNSQMGNQPTASIPAAGKLPHMDTIRPYQTFDMHSIRNQAQTKFRTTLDERDYLRQQHQNEYLYRSQVAESMNYAFNAYVSKLKSEAHSTVPVPGGPSIPKGYGIPKMGRSCGGSYTTTSAGRDNQVQLSARRVLNGNNYGDENQTTTLEEKIQTQFNRPSEEVELQGHNGHIYKGRLETPRDDNNGR